MRSCSGWICRGSTRRGGLHAGGAARDESAFRLGLRAGTDTTQSAHALAGRRFTLDRAASRLLATVH